MVSRDYQFRYIVIGDTNVGKSCLLMKFATDNFKEMHDPTIGVEFCAKNLVIDDKNVKLQIWDTAGQESFKSITRAYYRGAIIAILVYDITSKDSFKNIERWIDETKMNASEKIGIVLVGNKCELNCTEKSPFNSLAKRQVSYQEAEAYARERGFLFFEASAKTGTNISTIFETSTANILERLASGEISPSDDLGIKIKLGDMSNKGSSDKKSSSEGGGCCG